MIHVNKVKILNGLPNLTFHLNDKTSNAGKKGLIHTQNLTT